MLKEKMKQAVVGLGYWLVMGIPWLMAQAYAGLAKWKPNKETAVFKRVPFLFLVSVHVSGYILWAADHYRWFLEYARRHPVNAGDPRLGPFGPAMWTELCWRLQHALHRLLWAPLAGPLGLFWVWFVLFGPASLYLTIRFLVAKRSKRFDPEKLGTLTVSPQKVTALRDKFDKENANFLGVSTTSANTPVWLSDRVRNSHTYCVGATRSGKTVSVMLPLALQDIERGKPVFFFDGKGGVSHLAAITAQAERSGRAKDLMLFSLSDPKRSRTYNPLSFGNATQKKDRLIGAFTWTEEHYKKVCEETLLTVIMALEGTKQYYNLEDIYLCLTEREAVARVFQLCEDPRAKEFLKQYYDRFASVTKDIRGLIVDLGLLIKTDFWPLMDTYCPEIDFREVIREKKIVCLVLNTQANQETAVRLARIFLQDLRATSDYIQNNVEEEDRPLVPIYVDEFNSFAFDSFGDFMSKCGGAKFALTLAHQSLGQLAKVGDYFKEEILDNANVKIILRQDSPDAIEYLSRMGGTHKRTEHTSQTEDMLLFDKRRTGMGSARTVDTFNIDPNIIRQLEPHQAVIVMKSPFRYDKVQLDVRGGRKEDVASIDRVLPRREGRLPRGRGIDLRAYMSQGKGKFRNDGTVGDQ